MKSFKKLHGKNKNRVKIKVFSLLLLIFFSVFFLFPIYWIITSSLKTESQMFTPSYRWLFKPVATHYVEFFQDPNNLNPLRSSLIVSVFNTLLSITLGITAAYSLSRFSFKGKGLFGMLVLVLRMIPPVSIALPLFLVARRLGLYDTHLILILSTMIFTLPFTVWMMKGFFDSLPREIEESALIDGCSRLGVLLRIVIPLSMTGIAVTSVFCWFYSWNEFLYPLILSESKAKTLTVILNEFLLPTGEIHWGQMFAAGTITMLPAIAFGLLLREYFIKGITVGSLKE